MLYATTAESWRIDAYIDLKMQAATEGWSEAFERREGFLYGYEEWQTDAWIAWQLRQPHAQDFPWLRRLLAQSDKGE